MMQFGINRIAFNALYFPFFIGFFQLFLLKFLLLHLLIMKPEFESQRVCGSRCFLFDLGDESLLI